MHGRAVLRIIGLLAMAWLLVLPASAAAFPLAGGCSMTLSSTDAKGAPLDSARSGDGSASAEDPLQVDWEGLVSWSATSTISLQDNSYHLEMFGIPTPFRGASANTGDARSSSGTFGFKANAPFRFTGTYYLTGGITGSGGACTGTLVVKLIGDPVGTIPFFVGLGLLAIGGLLVVWGLKGHLAGSVVGGLILGIGLALLLTVFSVLPLAASTPAAALAVGVVLGLGSGIAGRLRARLPSPSPAFPTPIAAIEAVIEPETPTPAVAPGPASAEAGALEPEPPPPGSPAEPV